MKRLLRGIFGRMLHRLARVCPGATSLRPWLHRLRGVRLGTNVFIGDDVYIDNEYPEAVEIQSGAQISIRAIIIAHTRGPGKVIIGREVFIGSNAVISCSSGRCLRIGDGAVIGPGCVVTKSVPTGLYLAAAPPSAVATVGVPLPRAENMQQFHAGLAPLPTTAPAPRETRSAAKDNGHSEPREGNQATPRS